GKLILEKARVYNAIKEHQPVTSRNLSALTKTERTNITRSIYDLLNEITPQIKVAFIAKCKVTNRNVKHYTLIDWQKPEGGEHE
ncbi:MAG: hypothetical protein H7178_11015, partial [Chitinophagaceae bacterium]|nr:hypothetical protein [Chitinophagaceae bacterium]